jgi:hypothetical protein
MACYRTEREKGQMASTTTAKNLPLTLRLVFGALTGAFAGAASGGLAGGSLMVIFSSLVIVTPNNGRNFSPIETLITLVFAFIAGAFYVSLPTMIIGSGFGLFDWLLSGWLVRSLNGKLTWAVIGALLGAISAAVLITFATSNTAGVAVEPRFYLWAILGLPVGAIAGPIFDHIYSPLTTPFVPITRPAIAT